jgi:hypothetical protein
MKYYETKIGKIIEQEFDTRIESVVFIYIMDKGIERIKRITDEDIAGIEGDGLCTAAFNQNLVRCARHICTECEWVEIIEYIRLFLFCAPIVHEVSLYREDFSKDSFAELLHDLYLDDKEVGNEIRLYAIVNKECQKDGE